ncbi:hypothetical protein L596_022317 [Steinernema carpocapsae]|uniref:Uncharacterized protein n=1 Tax=Steinernema carpocapsae TaxID=34508 RepID=A0A4U5MM78_STECR|nr:hypothetical protein L596_022317 [Steinernema carpocapsae]
MATGVNDITSLGFFTIDQPQPLVTLEGFLTYIGKPVKSGVSEWLYDQAYDNYKKPLNFPFSLNRKPS